MITNSPYEFFSTEVSNWDSTGVEVSSGIGGSAPNMGFSGTSNDSSDGQNYITLSELPFQPITSMAQLQHAPLGLALNDASGPTSGYIERNNYPSIPNALGNSFALPFIPTNTIHDSQPDHFHWASNGSNIELYDKSYYANTALWDNWFFSGISPQDNPLVNESRSISVVLDDAVSNTNELPNSNYSIHLKYSTLDSAGFANSLLNDPNEGYKKVAAYMTCTGGFNVNSTSVNAWKAFLSGLDEKQLGMLSSETGNIDKMVNSGGQVPISRFSLPNREAALGSDYTSEKLDFLKKRWQGARYLNETELDELAAKIVEQVKERGPFLSLSEFINRRVASVSPLSQYGALQAAINDTSINESFNSSSRQITETSVNIGTPSAPSQVSLAYPNSGAALGAVSEGAPGYITQADILMSIAPQITVRSDTFRIRGYGQAVNSKGIVQARAWCEAIVQRTPEYTSGDDLPETETVKVDGQFTDLLSPTNKKFGRKFVIKSFKWLSNKEI